MAPGFRILGIVFLSLLYSLTTGCVGPTTPFGALDEVKPIAPNRAPDSVANKDRYKIKFHPEKQVLHDKFDFSIEIKSQRPMSEELELKISYNGLDVLSAFKENAAVHRSRDGQTLIYMFKDMRLKTLDLNDIQVQVVDESGRGLATEFFTQPECSLFADDHLARIGDFKAPDNYISLIEKVSETRQTNPSFLAGVVAQESGFNPNAVSWAKAIGLTQITPLAEEQVIPHIGDWPRYPGINTLSYMTLRSKIYLGEIDEDKEWRLNPEKSLEGGLTYFHYLKKYWELEDNNKLVEELGGDKNKLLTDLILASYNSGAARVKKAVQTHKHKWKEHESLQEAIHYLKRVNSYCYHFTKKEVEDDNET